LPANSCHYESIEAPLHNRNLATLADASDWCGNRRYSLCNLEGAHPQTAVDFRYAPRRKFFIEHAQGLPRLLDTLVAFREFEIMFDAIKQLRPALDNPDRPVAASPRQIPEAPVPKVPRAGRAARRFGRENPKVG